MKDRVDRIVAVAAANEIAKIEMLLSAHDDLMAAYGGDRSAANLKNWQAAEEALEKAVSTAEAKYFSEDPAFGNLMEVVAFLQDEGYKIKKSTLYLHRDKGLIRVDPDGSVKRAEAIAYITKAQLEKISDRSGNVDKLHERKAVAEAERTEVQAKKLKFELEKDLGKYLLKTDVKTEFALKLGAFESIFRNIIRTRSTDYIGVVGGKAEKAQLLVNLIYADMDEVLNGVCDLGELDIELNYKPMEESTEC